MLPRLRSLVAAALATLTAALFVVWALPGRLPPGQPLAMHADLAGHSASRHGDALRRVLSLQIGPAGAIAHEPAARPQRGAASGLAGLEFAEARPAAAPPLVRLASLSVSPTFESGRIALAPVHPLLQDATSVPTTALRTVAVRTARLADPEQVPEIERNDGLPVVVANEITEPEPDQTGALPSEPATVVEPPGARPAPAKAPWPRRVPRKAGKPSVRPTAARKPRATQKSARAPARARAATRPTQPAQQQFFPYYDGAQTPQTRPRGRSATQPQAETPWWGSQP